MKYQKRNTKIQYLSKLHPPKIKYLGIKLTKEVKDFYSENHKTLIKEIKEDTKKWKDIHAPGLEELILLKWLY